MRRRERKAPRNGVAPKRTRPIPPEFIPLLSPYWTNGQPENQGLVTGIVYKDTRHFVTIHQAAAGTWDVVAKNPATRDDSWIYLMPRRQTTAEVLGTLATLLLTGEGQRYESNRRL